MEELRRIEQDIAEKRREKPSLPVPANRPVPGEYTLFKGSLVNRSFSGEFL